MCYVCIRNVYGNVSNLIGSIAIITLICAIFHSISFACVCECVENFQCQFDYRNALPLNQASSLLFSMSVYLFGSVILYTKAIDSSHIDLYTHTLYLSFDYYRFAIIKMFYLCRWLCVRMGSFHSY